MQDRHFKLDTKQTKTSFPYEVLTPPASSALTLSEVKQFLKLSGDSEDDLLQLLIDTASSAFVNFTSRTLINTTYITYRDDFHDNLLIRKSKLQSIESIEYLKDGVLTAVDIDVYYIIKSNDYATIGLKKDKNFPCDIDAVAQAVKITFVAGFDAVPSDVKIGLLNHVNELYSNRGDCGDCMGSLPANTKAIYMSYKIINIGSSSRNYPSNAINSLSYRF